MDKENPYRKLLDDFFLVSGMAAMIKGREDFYQKADIVVDEVQFTLLPQYEEEQESLIFFCDFGELPQNLGGLVMLRLLEANLVLPGPGHPKFGVNFSTGHVLLSGVVPAARCNGKTLLQMLRHYAVKAKEWRETYFLLDEERALGAPRSARQGTAGLVRQRQKSSAAMM